MEEQKWRFLQDFLSRGDHISLDLCLSEIKKLEERTRRCYSENVPLNSNSFVLMILLDGCFVFEYIFQWYTHRFNFFSHSYFLVTDLLLIENQILFFIVEKLFEIGINQGGRTDFANFIVQYFAPAVYELDYTKVSKPIDKIDHLVHLKYHKLIPINPSKPLVLNSESFFPSMLSKIKNFVIAFSLWMLTRIFPKRNSLSSSFPNRFLKNIKSSFMISCATELQNAGIKLRPKSNPAHMLDISFINDVLEIPTLAITSEDTTTLANLIAFEQYNLDKLGSNLSSFALFLVSLANTKENVMLLQQCGIINYFSDWDSEDDRAEELTNFFKQISKGMIVEQNHYTAELFTEVNKYCESSLGRRQARWNKHKTQFVRTYFSSPWTKISLVAAGLVVLLTVVQSFYAVYAYYVLLS